MQYKNQPVKGSAYFVSVVNQKIVKIHPENVNMNHPLVIHFRFEFVLIFSRK